MVKVSNRGLGSLYLILAIHVILIVTLSPLTNAIPPVTEVFDFANVFSFDISPNFFADCNVRSFLFYIDDIGNKRQGDFGFERANLFTTFEIQSRATGVTIEDFEVQTKIRCSEDLGVANFDLRPTSSLVYEIFATNQDGDEVFIKRITVDPTVPPTGTRQASTMRIIDVQNKEVTLAIVKISADEIESKIKPIDSERRGTTSTAEQAFNSQLRIKIGYDFDFDIIGVKWEAFGFVENGYKIRFVDTAFSGTINQPLSTEISIKVDRPVGGVFSETGTRVLEVVATLPDYKNGEGLPSMTVVSSQTGITVASTVMSGSTATSGSAVFGSRIVLASLEEGSFKVSVSLPKRTTAQTIVKTFNAGSTGGVNGGNPVCNVDGSSIDKINPQNCILNTCEANGQVTSTFLGFGKFCSPPDFAWIFVGFNILYIFIGIIVFAIFIKIVTSIAGGGGSKVIVRSAVPTGF